MSLGSAGFVPRAKRLGHRALDRIGLAAYPIGKLPIGADFRKTIRQRESDEAFKTVLDVGANVGQFAIHLGQVFSQAEIYCFEPVSDSFESLKRNLARQPRMRPFKVALSDSEGRAEVVLQRDSSTNSIDAGVNDTRAGSLGTEIVPTTTLDKFCHQNEITEIDLLKIDTEGHELSVLKGAEGLLANRSVKCMLVETSFDHDSTRQVAFREIDAVATEYGFAVHGIYNQTIHGSNTRMDYCDVLYRLQS